MNKTTIKNYAIWARIQLIESCKQRAYEYGITEDGNYASNLKTVGTRILTDLESEQRNQLINQIRQKGYAQVMEEAAYTWFNRFIALRFMEVNGYLPSKVRVFTDGLGAFKPEILKEAMTIELDGIDRSVVIELLEKQDNEKLYKYLLITQCNALSDGLPYMFEKISNWTELLFPANLLRSDSVAGRMVSDIAEEDWTDAVQIIGWLYQYYNSELKDETFALLKKNVKITKERIPAATQLFTPDWIVRYMVENSLGRLWYEGHKDFDKSEWKYYLDEAEQEPEVEAELKKIREEYSKIKPEEIKVIDPCMGSGHILVYAFDVLMQIYTSAGWSERDAARSIIENNLYGLDIDDRAGQLAYFAVMMKARKFNRRIMTFGLQPNVMSIQDSSFMTNELIDFIAGNDAKIKSDLKQIKEIFTDAKEYGSILIVPELGYEAIIDRISEIKGSFVEDVFQIEYRDHAIEKLLPLIKQAVIMSQKYDVVVTNPPYMGISGMGSNLSEYIKDHYPDSKSDLFAAFIERCAAINLPNRFQSMITQHSWMFLSSYEKLREKLLYKTVVNMVHLGARAFEEIGGEVVQTTSFVVQNLKMQGYRGVYCRLTEPTTQQGKEDSFLSGYNRFIKSQYEYLKIPGSPIAYWLTDTLLNTYNLPKLYDVCKPCKGIDTGDNSIFLRMWFEVSFPRVQLPSEYPLHMQRDGDKKWYPYNKGGEYKKWFGNNYYVLNWENEGQALKAFKKSNLRNKEYYLLEGLTWATVSSGSISIRYFNYGFLFDNGGSCLFSNSHLKYILGYLNTIVARVYLTISPTLNTQPGDIGRLPFSYAHENEAKINILVGECIGIGKSDWDSFETSWDFKKHPLV